MSQTSGEGAGTKEATAAPEVEVASQQLPAENPQSEKVELDLEDAPFLKEEAKQEEVGKKSRKKVQSPFRKRNRNERSF